jgi:3,4-dihydroxy 2-butanone 4-phosphate synthase / GTP cyclohydrolase II
MNKLITSSPQGEGQPEAEFSVFVTQFKERKLGIVVDDSATSARSILIIPAQDATPERTNELITLSRGVLFVAITTLKAEEFQLGEMTRNRTESRFALAGGVSLAKSYATRKCFVSVEARSGVATGISASDRATTLRVIGGAQTDPRLLVSPGHVFPVEAVAGGVLVRAGLPEAAIDCVRGIPLSTYSDVAGYMDCLNENGALASTEYVTELAKAHAIPLVTISSIVRHRLTFEPLVTQVAHAKMPTHLAGMLHAYTFKSLLHNGEHLALVKGDITTPEPVLTRVQAESTFGDLFGEGGRSSREQLHRSLHLIGERGRGVLIYLSRAARGGVQDELAQLAAVSTNVKQEGAETRPISGVLVRQYGIGAQILRSLGVNELELLSHRSGHIEGLSDFGLSVAKRTGLFD